MKNFIIAVLLVVSIAFVAVAVAQRNRLKTQAGRIIEMQERIAALEDEAKRKPEPVADASLAEQKAQILQKNLAETSAAAAEKSQQVEKLQQKLDSAKTNDFGSLLGNMMKDPKVKEMIHNQQKAVIGPMVEKNYSALIKQLNLSPEQAATFKDLVEKKMMVAAESGTALLDSSLDSTQRAELTKQIKTDTEAYDAQIKEFLGEDNYKTLQSYEKTVPDRMALDQFNNQLGSGPLAMTSAQQDQLLQALSEERNNFKWTVDFNKQNAADGDLGALFTDENVNKFADEQKRFDDQCLNRIKPILSQEQFDAFAKFRKGQSDMQIVGMRMAAKMFGGGK